MNAELLRIAANIDESAATLRSGGRRLGSATSAARWHSNAATTARQHLEHTLARFGSAAAGLERAADELRSHAHRVFREEAALADISRAGHELEHGAVHAVGKLHAVAKLR